MHRKGKVKSKDGKLGFIFAIYQLKTQTLKNKRKDRKKKERAVHVWDTWNIWTSQISWTAWTASGEENNRRRQEVNWGVRRQWGSASLLNRQEIVSKGSGVNMAWPVCCSLGTVSGSISECSSVVRGSALPPPVLQMLFQWGLLHSYKLWWWPHLWAVNAAPSLWYSSQCMLHFLQPVFRFPCRVWLWLGSCLGEYCVKPRIRWPGFQWVCFVEGLGLPNRDSIRSFQKVCLQFFQSSVKERGFSLNSLLSGIPLHPLSSSLLFLYFNVHY